MVLTAAENAQLFDNQFVYDGNSYVRHLTCDTGIYLGYPEDIQAALAHLRYCPDPNGPAATYRGNPVTNPS